MNTFYAGLLFLALTTIAEAKLSPAMKAAARGDLNELQALDVDLMASDDNGAGILYFAAQSRKNSVEIFEFVRSRVGEGRFEKLLRRQVRSNGHTVALEAVFNSNARLVKYLVGLLQEGVAVNFQEPTVFGWTPKTFAEREKMPFASSLPEGSVAAADRLKWMKAQEDIWLSRLDARDREYHRLGMELIASIEKFDLDEINRLVAAGVSVNGRYGRHGATPLNSSVRPGMTSEELALAKKVQARLIRLGANPNYAEGGIMKVPSGFRESVFGYSDLIQAMIERFPAHSPERRLFLNYQGPLNGYTKLIDAALRGKGDVIKVLILAGADSSLRGHNGMTALEAARLYNEQSQNPLGPEILQMLKPGAL